MASLWKPLPPHPRLVSVWVSASRVPVQALPRLSAARFCSSAEKDPPKPKREPVNIATALDAQRELRRVEQRIEEHRQSLEAASASKPTSEENPLGDIAPGNRDVHLPVASAPGPLRLVDANAASCKNAAKDVVVRSRTTTGQVLWPATEEDIEILSQSTLRYPAPMEVEGSTIIRLVRLSDPVTSPVGRTVRNRQFGIRGNEKWQLLGMGAICAVGLYSLGIWQFNKMEWKKQLIEMRRSRLSAPRLAVNSSPFPWTDHVEDFVCRVVDIRGVFDHSREMRVGPRPGTDEETGDTVAGYNIVTPLRLEDGSTMLVNRGHVSMEKLDPIERPEHPTWVRVRGVLEEGEIANMVASWQRLKNRPDRNQFIYIVADELAENAGARNHEECKQALITAIDCLYEDDFKAGSRRSLPFSMKHKEDYLVFWADEHTHFNYAMQWFGLGSLIMTMTVYKFIEVSRWRW